ncbi:hypothetical protein BXY75_3353 [Ulvibacter antarcticus]|uniref:Uncharacterized protein n=1 Tax=Ulvibacter antarcticus TaxID=442714 RepID=A0A3L9YBC8_9FLAO|nr:hypothetical protein BXY75_3353 [Ulvibacter antarcticus]
MEVISTIFFLFMFLISIILLVYILSVIPSRLNKILRQNNHLIALQEYQMELRKEHPKPFKG